MSAVTKQEIIEALNDAARMIIDHHGVYCLTKYEVIAEQIIAHGIAPPDGWVLVPKEPTNEMFRNANVFGHSEASATLIWDAMLAGAPEVSE